MNARSSPMVKRLPRMRSTTIPTGSPSLALYSTSASPLCTNTLWPRREAIAISRKAGALGGLSMAESRVIAPAFDAGMSVMPTRMS